MGGRELSSDAALVRSAGIGPGHAIHVASSEAAIFSLPVSELSRMWESTPHMVLASLVRILILGLLLCSTGNHELASRTSDCFMYPSL